MARNKGTFKFAATLEVQAANALDPRGVVNTKAELINKETWPYEGETIYVYNCMQVAVVEEKAVYMLIDPSKILESDYSGWKKIDASAATVVEVIDNLLSTNPNAALSANQGKILDDKISALSTKLTSIFKFKGSKDNLDAIQAIESPETGDVYHNSANGGEYVYDGTQWELLGLTISSETAPTSFDASAITSGTISLERLPKGALERLFIVSSENDAMHADCQEGDTVQVTGNDNKMYFCVNGSATTFANKFREYTAGAATSVPWSGVTGRPNVEDGAQKNVQSDWNATSGDAFILNKPTIPTKTSQLTNDSDFATQTVINTALATKADKTEVEELLDRANAAISKEETDRKAAVAALQSLIDTMNPGYQFMGVATPETNPGTPDQKIFYLASQDGTYPNFGNIAIENEVAILSYDTTWHKLDTGIKKVTISQNTQTGGYDIAVGSGSPTNVAGQDEIKELNSKIGVTSAILHKGNINNSTGVIAAVYPQYIYSNIIKGPFRILLNNGYYIYNIWEFANESSTTGTTKIMHDGTKTIVDYSVTGNGLYRCCIQKIDVSNFTFDANNICMENVISSLSNGINKEIAELKENKQNKLVSGTNIKTVNGNSILGAGNLVIAGDAKDDLIKIETIYKGSYTFPNDAWTDDAFIHKNTGLPTAYASAKYTADYYRILQGRWRFNWSFSGNGVIAAFYDANKNFIGYVQGNVGEYDIPVGAVYARFSCSNNTTAAKVMTYLSETNLEQINTRVGTLETSIGSLRAQAPAKPRLYPNATLPVIAFQFDDCTDNDAQVVELFKSKGLTCGFAFIASEANFASKGGVYLGYQREGFDILNHSVDGKIFNTDNYTEQTAREAITTALDRFRKAGMIVNGWVSPSSSFNSDWINIIKQTHAYAFTYNDEHLLGRESNPCTITRNSMENNTIAYTKTIIDARIQNDQLLVLYGHPANFGTDPASIGETWSLDKLEEILDYCISKMNAGLCYVGSNDDCIKYFFNL